MRISDWSSDVCSSDLLAWLAVAAMAVNITSGLTGKYLVQRSQRWMKQAKTELRDEGLADSEIEQQLFWNSLAAGLVRKWRTIHLPIALAFAVLATRSAERRGGKECVSTCRSGGCPSN